MANWLPRQFTIDWEYREAISFIIAHQIFHFLAKKKEENFSTHNAEFGVKTFDTDYNSTENEQNYFLHKPNGIRTIRSH